MSAFKTQEELHRFLLDGGSIIYAPDSMESDVILSYKEGSICYQDGRNANFIFNRVDEWKPYLKKEWYEQIPEGGVWCYMETEGEVNHIFKYRKDTYMTKTDLGKCKPITKEFYEEIGKHIYE